MSFALQNYVNILYLHLYSCPISIPSIIAAYLHGNYLLPLFNSALLNQSFQRKEKSDRIDHSV